MFSVCSEMPGKLKISKISLYLLSLISCGLSILRLTDISNGKSSDHWRLSTMRGDSHKETWRICLI